MIDFTKLQISEVGNVATIFGPAPTTTADLPDHYKNGDYLKTGTAYFCVDTGDLYMWNEANHTWNLL